MTNIKSDELQRDISKLAGELMVIVRTKKVIDYTLLDKVSLLFDELARVLKDQEYVSKSFIGAFYFVMG